MNLPPDDCRTMAEKLIAIGGLPDDRFVTDELEEALYQLLAIAQDPYNNGYYRILWNVLISVTKDDYGDALIGASIARGDWVAANRFLGLYPVPCGAPLVF